IYHKQFQTSKHIQEHYTMLGINVIARETDEEATWLTTSLHQQFLYMVRGKSSLFKPPVDDIEAIWTAQEKHAVLQTLAPKTTIVGSPETVKEKLNSFLQETKTNEFIISSPIFNDKARMRSFEIFEELLNKRKE